MRFGERRGCEVERRGVQGRQESLRGRCAHVDSPSHTPRAPPPRSSPRLRGGRDGGRTRLGLPRRVRAPGKVQCRVVHQLSKRREPGGTPQPSHLPKPQVVSALPHSRNTGVAPTRTHIHTHAHTHSAGKSVTKRAEATAIAAVGSRGSVKGGCRAHCESERSAQRAAPGPPKPRVMGRRKASEHVRRHEAVNRIPQQHDELCLGAELCPRHHQRHHQESEWTGYNRGVGCCAWVGCVTLPVTVASGLE